MTLCEVIGARQHGMIQLGPSLSAIFLFSSFLPQNSTGKSIRQLDQIKVVTQIATRDLTRLQPRSEKVAGNGFAELLTSSHISACVANVI